MKLEQSEIKIRNATPEDASVLARWWNDGLVMSHAGFPNGLGISEKQIVEDLKKESDISGRTLIIEYQNIPIGEMCFRNKGNQTAGIGIKICEFEYQKKGLGKMVLSMLIKDLFSSGYKKIILDTNLNNRLAQHVYEKLGFQKVSIKIDAWKDQLGNFQSSIDYELSEDTFVDFSSTTSVPTSSAD